MEAEWRESLLCRFIINLTQEEKDNDRLFFHLQNAYWYYLDFLLPKDKMTQIQFYQWLLQPLPEFRDVRSNLQYYLKKHKQYSKTIPLYGAILMNEAADSVLLVMNFSKTVYSFPKGKVNENEAGSECAVREVWEEVGYDISKKIKDNDYLEFICEDTGQPQRMYIISGVNENHKFITSTRFEIGLIKWVQINEIAKGDQIYASLMPFIQGLQKYLKHQQQSEVNAQKQAINKAIIPKQLDLVQLMQDRTTEILKEFRKLLKSNEPRINQQLVFEQFKLVI